MNYDNLLPNQSKMLPLYLVTTHKTPQNKLTRVKLFDNNDTTRTPYKKVYDNLQHLTGSYTYKENFY